MKKISIFLLTILLLSVLCACTREPAPVSDPQQQEQQAALTDLLTQAGGILQPGAAGSSLKAAYMAATMLDWCETCTLSPQAIQDTAAAFTGALTENELSMFSQQADQLAEYCLFLSQGDSTALGLLGDCGYNGGSTQWSAQAAETAQSILAALNP